MDKQLVLDQLLIEIKSCLGFGIVLKHHTVNSVGEYGGTKVNKKEHIVFSRNLTLTEKERIGDVLNKYFVENVSFRTNGVTFEYGGSYVVDEIEHEEVEDKNPKDIREQLLNILNNSLSEDTYNFKYESSRIQNPTIFIPNKLISHSIGTELNSKLKKLDYIDNFEVNSNSITVNFKITNSDLITYIDDTETKVIEGLQSGRDRKIVTVDYDHTFCHPHTKEAIREFMRRGYEIFILTYRFDELNKHRYPINPTNDDMYNALEEFGIGKEKIIFMNSELKGKYLSYTPNVLYHIDDREEELQSIKRYAPHVRLIKCTDIELRDYFTDTVII